MRAILLILALAGNSWAVKITQTTSGSGSGGTTDSTKVRLTGDVMSGPLTASSLTVTGAMQASSGVFTGGWGVSNTYGAVLVASGTFANISTSNVAGTNIFRVYGASGNAIAEFNQNGNTDAGANFRLWNNAQSSIFTITGNGIVSANGSISGKGLTNTVTRFSNSVASELSGPVTLINSSMTISGSGIYAASGTFTNGVTASSGSFTQTSTYSIVSSSGLFLRAGTIDLSMKPDIGIRYYDGSVSTTAALPASGGAAYTANVSTRAFDPAEGITNTTFGGCFAGTSTATITSKAGNHGVKATFAMYGESGTGTVIRGFTVIRDQVNFPDGGSSSLPIAKNTATVNIGGGSIGVAWFPAQSAGVHNFCVAGEVNTGTFTTTCNSGGGVADNQLCYLIVEEIP